ncbi:MAG: hypothetical protein JEZ09_17265 [Salinivirgaceae bacterium]|nr:hypothetical protein [Salinivirgaceae bacterium]
MKNRITKISMAFIIVMVCFTSCEKDKNFNTEESKTSQESDNILCFKSVEDHQKTLNKVSAMNLQELIEYEDSQGYKSFGRKSDEIYYSVNPESFKSLDDLKDFVSINDEYLQLIEDENGEYTLETKYYYLANKYIMNNDNMYQINNTVYKVFNSGIASAPIEHTDILKMADESIISKVAENYNIKFESNNKGEWCGNQTRDVRSTNGKNRTYFRLTLNAFSPPGGSGTNAWVDFFARPYKKTLGVWYHCKRSISFKINCSYYGRTSTGWPNKTINRTGSSYAYSVLGTLPDDGSVFSSKTANNIVYSWIDSWADTPDTDYARIQCNESSAN